MFSVMLGGYLFVLLLIGFLSSRRGRANSEDVHLASRSHGAVTAALSSCASTESGFVCLGMVGMGYTLGMNAFWILPAGIMGYCLNWLVLGPRIFKLSRTLRAYSLSELVLKRTGGTGTAKWVTFLLTVICIIFLISYVSAQFIASGKAVSVNADLSQASTLGIAASVIVFYACLGSYRAVVWTDILQALMMLFTLILVPTIAIYDLGGITAFWTAVEAQPGVYADSFAGAKSGGGMLMAALPWLMLGLAYPGQPHAVSRVMACRSRKLLVPAALISCIWFVCIYAGAIVLGMVVRVGFGGLTALSDAESILPMVATAVFSPMVGGLILASILAAIASTADSALMAAATLVARALKGRAGLAGQTIGTMSELSLTRLIILGLGALALLLAFALPNLVFSTVVFAWSGLGVFVGPALIYCCFARGSFATPILCGLIVTFIAMCFLKSHSLNLLLGFVINNAVMLGSHFWIRRFRTRQEDSVLSQRSPNFAGERN